MARTPSQYDPSSEHVTTSSWCSQRYVVSIKNFCIKNGGGKNGHGAILYAIGRDDAIHINCTTGQNGLILDMTIWKRLRLRRCSQFCVGGEKKPTNKEKSNHKTNEWDSGDLIISSRCLFIALMKTFLVTSRKKQWFVWQPSPSSSERCKLLWILPSLQKNQ